MQTNQNTERIIVIDERREQSKEELLRYIAERLQFPEYFGMNYDALHDCLGEVGAPTVIEIITREDTPQAKAVATIWRMAEDISKWNQNLRVSCRRYEEAEVTEEIEKIEIIEEADEVEETKEAEEVEETEETKEAEDVIEARRESGVY